MSAYRQISRRIVSDMSSNDVSGQAPSNSSISISRINPPNHGDSVHLRLRADSTASQTLLIDGEEASSDISTIATLVNYLSENAADILKNQAKMKRFEQITAEVVKNDDPALQRIAKQHGWNGSKYPRQNHAALDTESYLRALVNLFLSQRNAADGVKSNIPVEATSESEKVISFIPDVLIRHLTSALVIEKGDISCSTFHGAALLADISGFSTFAAEKCSHGVAGLNVLRDVTNGFLGDLVHIVYRYGGDVVAFAGDALICVFVDQPQSEYDEELTTFKDNPENFAASNDDENGWKSASKKQASNEDFNDISASYVSDDDSSAISRGISRKNTNRYSGIFSHERRTTNEDTTHSGETQSHRNSLPTIQSAYIDESEPKLELIYGQSENINIYSTMDSPTNNPQILGLKASETFRVQGSMYRKASQNDDENISEASKSFSSPLKYRANDPISFTPRKPESKSAKVFSGEGALSVLNRVMSRKGTGDMSSPQRRNSDESPMKTHRSGISDSSRSNQAKHSSSEKEHMLDTNMRKPSMLYLDKLEESRSEMNCSEDGPDTYEHKPMQHKPKHPFDPDPYMRRNCCLRALECALLLREQSAHSGVLATHIAVSYGEMKLAILGGHNDDWVYLLNGECISELGPCLNAAGKKQVVATKVCYDIAMSGIDSANNFRSSIPDLKVPSSFGTDDQLMTPGSIMESSMIGSVEPNLRIISESPERSKIVGNSLQFVKSGASFGSPLGSPLTSTGSGGEDMNYILHGSTLGVTNSSIDLAEPLSMTSPTSQRYQRATQASKTFNHSIPTVIAKSTIVESTISPNLGMESFTNKNLAIAGQSFATGITDSTTDIIVSEKKKNIEDKNKRKQQIIHQKIDDSRVLILSITSDRIPAEHPMRLKKMLHNSPPTVVDAAKLFVSRPVLSAVYSDSLDTTAEVRHVVIMFVSLDSYSIEAHKDPLELQPFFKVVQEALHQSGGYLRQFVVDDKGCVVVAMWGVPQFSYFNNNLRGLFCGVAINRRAQQLNLKTSVGLTTGEICYCGIVGGTLRRDYAIIGDKVNMAARFMSIAKGKVLMDLKFKDGLSSNIQSQLIRGDTVKLKGASQPVTPYIYVGNEIPINEVLEDHEGQTTVLRRQVRMMLSNQLDKISNQSAVVDQVRQAGSLSMKSVHQVGGSNDFDRYPVNTSNAIATIIMGLPGTGKSTAAQHFEQEARKRNLDCIKIIARPGDESRPYSVIRKLFLELVGTGNFRDEAQQRAQVKEAIRKAYFSYSDEVKQKAEVTLEIILGLPWSEGFKAQTEDDSMTPSDFNYRQMSSSSVIKGEFEKTGSNREMSPMNVIRPKAKWKLKVGDLTFYNVLRALISSRKTVIIIEDADYCDELSWNEFHLMLTGQGIPLALTITMRTPPLNRKEHDNDPTRQYTAISQNQIRGGGRSRGASESNESRGIIRAFSTMTLFRDNQQPSHAIEDHIPTVTITRASGEIIDIPITEFDTYQTTNPLNTISEIGASKYGIRFRPNHAYLSMLTDRRCKVIEMNPLTEIEINELLNDAMNIDNVERELVLSVLDVTAGNAFWCKAIAKFIRENGIEEYSRTIVRRGGNFNYLRSLILNRIDRLTDEQRNVAKHAAIIGDEFTLSVLRAILPQRIQNHLKASLDALQQNGLLYCVEESQEVIFSFQNQLIRNTIYDLTPPSDADMIHLAVANQLEYQYADDLRQLYPSLSYHYRNSFRHNGEKREQALKYTVKAADQAISRQSYADGFAFLQLAVPFAETIDEYRTLLEVVRAALEDLAPSRYEDIFNRFKSVRRHFLDSRSVDVNEAETVRLNIQLQYTKLQADLYKAMNRIQSVNDSSGATGSGSGNTVPTGQETGQRRDSLGTRESHGNRNVPNRRRFPDFLGCMSGDNVALPTLANELSYVRTRRTRNRSTCSVM